MNTRQAVIQNSPLFQYYEGEAGKERKGDMKPIHAAIAAAGLMGLTACQTTGTEEYAHNDRFARGSRAAAEAAITGEGEVLCRRVIRTGTLFHGNICLTLEEWQAVHDEGREALANMDQHVPQGNVSGLAPQPGAGKWP